MMTNYVDKLFHKKLCIQLVCITLQLPKIKNYKFFPKKQKKKVMMKVVVISCHIKSYAHQLYVKLCDFLKNKEAGMNVFPKKKGKSQEL
jgi:hypothetical protein